MNSLEIEIGGKKRYLKFNLATLELLTRKVNPHSPDTTTGYILIYAALSAGAHVQQQDLLDEAGALLTFETCCDWVDELGEPVIESVLTAFKSSSIYLNKIAPLLAIKEEENGKNVKDRKTRPENGGKKPINKTK